MAVGGCRQLGLASKGVGSEDNDRLSSIQLLPKLVPAFVKRPVKVSKHMTTYAHSLTPALVCTLHHSAFLVP